jgi:hypothetical protein
MPSHAAESQVVRAIEETTRQTKRAQRAEAVRRRQRARLLELMAEAMSELHIPFSELKAAQRTLAHDARDAHSANDAQGTGDRVSKSTRSKPGGTNAAGPAAGQAR